MTKGDQTHHIHINLHKSNWNKIADV